MSLVQRRAEPEDHAPIVAVVEGWWGGCPMRAMPPRLVFTHCRPTSFVAEDDGAVRALLVGPASQPASDQAYIYVVGVDPTDRAGAVPASLHGTRSARGAPGHLATESGSGRRPPAPWH